jgi:hypothetical protein
MTQQEWVVLSPVGVRRPVERRAPAARTGTGQALGFLSNRKPNATRLMEHLGRMVAAGPGLEVRYYEKAHAATGAGGPLVDRIAAECRLVVTGTGD